MDRYSFRGGKIKQCAVRIPEAAQPSKLVKLFFSVASVKTKDNMSVTRYHISLNLLKKSGIVYVEIESPLG